VVGDVGVPARRAGEPILASPVRLVAMATREARSGRVARVDRDERHTGQLRLVLDELPQLGERPVGQPGSLFASLPYGSLDGLIALAALAPMLAAAQANRDKLGTSISELHREKWQQATGIA